MDHYRDDQSSRTLGSISDSGMAEEEKEQLLELNPRLLEAAAASRNTWLKLRALCSPCAVFLLAVSNIFLLAAFFAVIVERHQHANDMAPMHTSHLSWQPPEHYRTEIFRFNPVFGAEPSDAVDAAWTSLIPRFVNIENGTSLPDLPRLDSSPTEHHAMISMFHQLHCLYMTRTGYFAAKAGNLDDVNVNHLTHCWDYLRQGIMCSADTSLEWIQYPRESGSTGWGYQHTCKDFGAIFSWAEENRMTDRKVIH
ncbi:hypothetical protein B0T17DRAFT_646931 [Bombardia bombarda]|uniref:Oxidase ustYa n=1 Tax=Bombardia bombarda TaxID=252184 RepID=A0AA40BVK6_9PEZI|nr:hypothetical protein B0T17DRAFT_646931 [Bombardia bombarda]